MKKEKYITDSISIFFLGLLGAIIGIIFYSPVHEVFHCIIAIMLGYHPEFHLDYVVYDGHDIVVAYAGIYGELLFYSFIIKKATKGKYFGWATYFLGYLMALWVVLFVLTITYKEGQGWIQDVDEAMLVSPYSIVYMYLWVVITLLTIINLVKGMNKQIKYVNSIKK